MAATSVPAPIWRRHAGGLGQRQVGSIQGSERNGDAGQAMNLAMRKRSGNGESPQPQRLGIGKGTRSRRTRMCKGGENTRTSCQAVDANPGRSESRMPARAPVTNLWPAGRKTGQREARHRARKHALTDVRIEGSPEIPRRSAHPHAGESGVGSNAGPICYPDRPKAPLQSCSDPSRWRKKSRSPRIAVRSVRSVRRI